MIKHTPPMGWNTWNTFGQNIDESLIMKSADVLVESGLKDAGYEYVVIDDCWSLKERDANGRLVADPEKFPHGMKYVADYVHSKGLKFGMYSCAGSVTCAMYPGSYEHEFTDAQTFAEWGVDFLKYDYCYRSMSTPGDLLYKRMGIALANCGRDIFFSACSWGADDTRVWIKETGANSWRSTGDIFDNWVSVREIIRGQLRYTEYNGQGCFNDLDMLIIGMNGNGNCGRNDGGCTLDESLTHFAFWCLFGSPLMLGSDIRNMSEDVKKIVTNKTLLRIDQDEKYCQPFLVEQTYYNFRRVKNHKLSEENDCYYADYNPNTPIVAKYLDDGTIAVGIFNLTDDKMGANAMTFLTESLGVPESSGKRLKFTNAVDGTSFYSKNGIFVGPAPLNAHCSAVYIAEVVDNE